MSRNPETNNPEKESIKWCLAALDKCWEVKSQSIRASEIQEAEQAYDYARNVYRKLLDEE